MGSWKPGVPALFSRPGTLDDLTQHCLEQPQASFSFSKESVEDIRCSRFCSAYTWQDRRQNAHRVIDVRSCGEKEREAQRGMEVR